MSKLKLQIIGRVGKDPDTREVGNSKVTKFTVAHSEKYTDKQGNKVENTTWVNVEGWDKTGEILAKHVRKGDQIYIEGVPKAEAWVKDGEAKGGLAVRVREFAFLGGSKNTESAATTETGQSATSVTAEQIANSEDDNLPF